MTKAKDCCEGEPFRGDPNGLHAFDCPVYQATCETWAARRESPFLPPATSMHQYPGPLTNQPAPDAGSTSAQLARVTRERDYFADAADKLQAERVALQAKVAEARAALHWVVARDANYVCERCGRLIGCGEAYVPPPADGEDLYVHVRCPN